MRKGLLSFLFWGSLFMWGYWFPYQWWLKYGNLKDHTEVTPKLVQSSEADTAPTLPEPFWGASLDFKGSAKPSGVSKAQGVAQAVPSVNFANAVLDEVKACFGEGPMTGLSTIHGDLSNLVSAFQSQLGPVEEDILLEKKAILKLKNGRSRTLVYEWISPEEGSDVYWHDTDEEGYPRPVDLPEGSGHDPATFERLKSQGTVVKTLETRLIQLQTGIQLGIEKVDETPQSVSVKDDGHLIKCRRDSVKTFVCDCLN